MKELLTASRMAALLACVRRHFYRYEVGLRSLMDAAALRFGSAWHRGMEARWQGASIDVAYTAALGDAEKLDELAVATLSGLLAGYYARYAEDPVKTVHPETEFRHGIEGSRTFDSAGKIDGLGVMHDGRLVLIEHKTCGEDIAPDSDYWLRLRANQQVFQYIDAARRLGWDIALVIYDVTRKPAIRLKQGESCKQFAERLAADCKERPDFYFARREVPILEADLAEFQVQRAELGKLILALRQAERRVPIRQQAWPRNVSSMGCRNCEFQGFCLQGVQADAEHVPGGFTIGPTHGELNMEGAQ
ncbi:MAG: PD-(D/E)XK nuclease family protein [Lentisphaerae bacterium]|nr:PD-(D/E)XK nuclease family protein [Lentisphaerota bacterium]